MKMTELSKAAQYSSFFKKGDIEFKFSATDQTPFAKVNLRGQLKFFKRITNLEAEQAIALARWILDTFSTPEREAKRARD